MPAEVRRAVAEHARAEEPNEACGLLVARDGVALRYEPGTNLLASPYRFAIKPADPGTLFLEDEGYEIGLVHSHVSSRAQPSKTDVQKAREDWPGRPFLIYSIAHDELAAFRIHDGSIERLALA
ncbi:MAG: Mov34/MPN/PAD-1 family protein [Gaiellaceae bacterium]